MSSSSSSSFILDPLTQDSSTSSLDSLPSSSSSSLSDPDQDTDADREWQESLQQIELLLTMVVVPYLGKYFGRKCAYWGWAKVMEWKFPGLDVQITDPTLFRAAGAVEAAAAL